MNYKIKVDVDIEELISLFSALGCKYFNCTVTEKNYMIVEDGKAFFCKLKSNFKKSECKEISIDQLKDMVVLKRNDVADATHKCIYDNIPEYFMASDGVLYFYKNTDWVRTKNTKLWCDTHLKPITKEPVMKEYLNKLEDGTYKLVVLDSVADGVEGLIEIPGGMNYAYKDEFNIHFTKLEMGYRDSIIVWQRETLNDKVASAEVARQSGVFVGAPFSDLPAFNFGAIDDFVESNVEQTLIDRESTYGSFKDVADTTSKLMGVLLNSKNGQMLPCTHQEALHMICSKMARIVNGDYDYKDNWHDIGGYAKLIENLIDGV